MSELVQPLKTVTVGEIEPPPANASHWLVRSLWPAHAVGLLAGNPKSFKTWLGLDLAISIASATPCLEHFQVEQPGPVLAFLAEDSLLRARERIAGIVRRRRLDLTQLRLHLITEPVVRLDRERDVERLTATVEALRPRLLLLDPLVRMHAINENDAGEVSAVLGRLRQLQRTYDLAIALVHHSKKNGRPSGESLRGSSDLYAWGDTYAYMHRTNDALRLVLEHRYERPIEPVVLRMVGEDGGENPHLELGCKPTYEAEQRLDEMVVAALTAATRPLTRTVLREQLRVNNLRLGQVLSNLAATGVIQRDAQGWVCNRPFRSGP